VDLSTHHIPEESQYVAAEVSAPNRISAHQAERLHHTFARDIERRDYDHLRTFL
jgi:hypothetical protein